MPLPFSGWAVAEGIYVGFCFFFSSVANSGPDKSRAEPALHDDLREAEVTDGAWARVGSFVGPTFLPSVFLVLAVMLSDCLFVDKGVPVGFLLLSVEVGVNAAFFPSAEVRAVVVFVFGTVSTEEFPGGRAVGVRVAEVEVVGAGRRVAAVAEPVDGRDVRIGLLILKSSSRRR